MATLQEIDAQIAALNEEAANLDSRGGQARIRKQMAALKAQRLATQNMTVPAADLNAQIAAAQQKVEAAQQADQIGQIRNANTELNALLATKKSRDATALLANPAGASPAQIWAARQIANPTVMGGTDPEGNYINPADENKIALATAHATQNTPQWQATVNAYNTGQQVPDEFVPLLNRLNSYYTDGAAAPGALVPEVAGQALRQWGIDAQPGGFDKFMNIAVPIAMGVLTGGVGGLGAIGGGAVAGGTRAGMQGGGLGDIAKGAITGGALAYGGGMLADYAGLGSAAADAGMTAAELAAAPSQYSLAGMGTGTTGGFGATGTGFGTGMAAATPGVAMGAGIGGGMGAAGLLGTAGGAAIDPFAGTGYGTGAVASPTPGITPSPTPSITPPPSDQSMVDKFIDTNKNGVWDPGEIAKAALTTATGVSTVGGLMSDFGLIGGAGTTVGGVVGGAGAPVYAGPFKQSGITAVSPAMWAQPLSIDPMTGLVAGYSAPEQTYFTGNQATNFATTPVPVPGFAKGGQVRRTSGLTALMPHLIQGEGDGLSDDIPAYIDGEGAKDREPIRVTDGEYIIPSDAVSGLGNGSTDAGARALDAMVAKIRNGRTGSKKPAKKVDAQKMVQSV